MMAADTEIESFLTKFKCLCSSGINASLNISSSQGKAIVTLHAEIGFLTKPTNVPHTGTPVVKHRSPAYHRRIARRHATRQFTDNINSSNEAEEASIVDNVDTNVHVAVKPATVDDAVTQSEIASGIESVQAEQDCNDSNVEHIENIEDDEELSKDEVERDRLVEEVIIYMVGPSDIRQPVPGVQDVEKEIRERFSLLGVDVLDIRTRASKSGAHESSLVKVTPINLRKIWGRRLGLKHCALIEYKQPERS